MKRVVFSSALTTVGLMLSGAGQSNANTNLQGMDLKSALQAVQTPSADISGST